MATKKTQQTVEAVEATNETKEAPYTSCIEAMQQTVEAVEAACRYRRENKLSDTRIKNISREVKEMIKTIRLYA